MATLALATLALATHASAGTGAGVVPDGPETVSDQGRVPALAEAANLLEQGRSGEALALLAGHAAGGDYALVLAAALVELSLDRQQAARQRLQILVQGHPDRLSARRLLAATELRRNAPAQAAGQLEYVLALWPDDPLARALLATARLESGDVHGAIDLVRSLREADVDLPQLAGLDHLLMGPDGIAEADLAPLGAVPGLERELLAADGLAGLLEFAAGDYDRALESGKRILAGGQDAALGYNLVAAAYLAKGERVLARVALENALAVHPALVAVDLTLARMDLEDGDAEAAEVRYGRVLARVPNHLDALMGLVELTEMLERGDESLGWLEQAWRHHPAVREVGLMMVKRYLERTRIDDALVASRQLLALFPDDGPVVRARGLALLADGSTGAAMDMLLRLVHIEPAIPENWHLLATGLLRQQDYPSARRALDEALALQPDFLPSLIVRVQLEVLDDDLAAALMTARRVQRLYPTLSVGHQLEGEVRARRGEYPESSTAFGRALEFDPQARLVLLRAAAQRQGGDVDGAIAGLRDWLMRHPRDVTVRARLAQYLEQARRVREALAEYRRIERQDPGNVLAHNNMAWIYLFRGDGRALYHAERAHALDPERPEIMDTLGWTLVSFGRAEEGLVLLEEAIRRAPQLADIRYHLAVAYERSGRPDDARRELERLLGPGQYEAFSYGEQAAAMLERLSEPDPSPSATPDSPRG